MKIGDLFLALGVDSADFKAVVTKEAEAAGKVGASKFSSTFATGLKVGSVIVGAAFGLMAKGAIEMEKSQGKFQAATGRSREEAIEFSKAMNGIVGTAKTVGASFEEISDTGIAVSQQFDITGQKATDLTEDILGFAKVTGQDASDAALQLEDTLSAFGLSADDASGFMDQLVASSQKFGTDAGPATLSILQGMAPALQAMGMGMDDGIALLNAFEVAGVDAAGAQRGLNSAITNLPPGTSMEEFLQHLQDLRNRGIDPTAKAIEVFGNKAGAALALTIKPGGRALDDFRVSAEEAAGAADQAAEDMLTTADKIKMFTEKAGGFLRGLGQDFGPVVTGLASLASLSAPFAKGIVGLFTGLLRHVGILAAATAVGTAAGGAQAAGHEVAATGPGAIKSLAARIAAMSIPLAGAGTTVGTAVGGAMAAGVTAGWLVAIGAGAGAAIFGPRLLLEKLTGNDEEGKLRGQTLAYAVSEGFSTAAGSGAGDAMVAAVVAAIAAGKTREESYLAGEAAALAFLDGWVEPWTGGADNTSGMDAFNSYMDQLAELGRAGGTAAGAATATTWVAKVVEVLAGEGKAHMASAGLSLTEALSRGTTSADASRWMFSAAEQLSSMLKDFLSPEGQGLELIGKKYTKLVAEGVKSGSPDAVRVAQQFAIDSIAAIENAGLEGKKGQQGLKAIGSYFVSLMSSGMDANTAVGRLAGAGVSLETIEGIKTKYPQFFTAGSGATSEFADGTSSPGALANSRTSGTNVAQAFIAGIASFLHSEVAERRVHDAAADATSGIRGQSPPKVGPLRFIDKWGENIGAAWLDGVKKGIGGVGPLLTAASGMAFNIGSLSGTGKLELHHTVDIRGDSGNLDNRKVADMLNDGASGFAWNLEHAMSAVTSG